MTINRFTCRMQIVRVCCLANTPQEAADVELIGFCTIGVIPVLWVYRDVNKKLFGGRRIPDNQGGHHRRPDSGGQRQGGVPVA